MLVRIVVCAIALSIGISVSNAGDQPQTQIGITVIRLPPEEIPRGTCSESETGLLETTEKGQIRQTKFTDKEVGEYVNARLRQGFIVSLYPQISGRVFVRAECKAAVIPKVAR